MHVALSSLLAILSLTLLACAQAKSTQSVDGEVDAELTADVEEEQLEEDEDPETELAELLDQSMDQVELLDCEPSTQRCVTPSLLESCDEDGHWQPSPCLAPRRCEAEQCILPEPLCEPKTQHCDAFDSLALCSDDGYSLMTQSCAPGRCVDDQCRLGLSTGETCNDDEACAGGLCHCATGCAGALQAGYCSTKQCSLHGCAPAEACIQLSDGEELCVRDCSSCLRQGFGCRELRRADGTWSEVCYALEGQAELASVCSVDSDCAGGLCLLNSASGRPIEGGYCSSPCSRNDECPSGAACVKVDGLLSGQGFCALRCVDGHCPPARAEDFYIYCFSAAPVEALPAVSICFQN
ncbi:MAG: hypothetical protein RBU37_15135 [Myxococcota bacterium]|jgi:hypothetical protein|nr:hypothetical protein [Myxococcota bacterium]